MAIGATAVWRVRPSGSNTNGGGYDPGIGGAATDYSQQNAAQASGSNATCTTGTSTFVDATANAFTSAMVGNAIWIASGTNFIAGPYFVTAFTSASTVTLDRTPVTGSNGTVGVWKLGGGWADFWTNTSFSNNYIVPGNTVYILGAGIPNPASYSADYTWTGSGTGTNVVNGNNSTSGGRISFLNDPATPSYKAPPDTTGGMPLVSLDGIIIGSAQNTNYNTFSGIWFIARSNLAGPAFNITGSGNGFIGNVFDGVSTSLYWFIANFSGTIAGNEFFNSGTPGGGPYAIAMENILSVVGNNFHDGSNTYQIYGTTAGGGSILNNIIAKNTGIGINIDGPGYIIMNNTIDGNSSHGIQINATNRVADVVVLNNIISNHTGGNGLNLSSGTAAQNSRAANYIDYNVYYNNSANYSGINAGPHDTALAVTPYVGSATENYQLA